MEQQSISSYTDILLKSGTFISLDISVKSTGYVRYYNGKLDYGTYTIKAVTDVDRRREFADFLVWLIDGKQYDYIVLEDVIFGNNYKTTKILMQLNVIVEDLMTYKKISPMPVIRINNLTWKKVLSDIAGTKEHNVKGGEDKERVRTALKALNLDLGNVPQDIYDAFGIAIAYIYEHYFKDSILLTQQASRKLHTDLLHCYVIKQCKNTEELQVISEKKYRHKKQKQDVEIVTLDSTVNNKPLLQAFKEAVTENGDQHIFRIIYDVNRVGSLLLTKYVDMELCEDKLYICAYLR